jgi:uncharacterized protein YndB with AHSA1/START domain
MLIEHRDIDAPATTAWRLLTDTDDWPRWGPSVRAVETSTRIIGPGVRGRVQTATGLWLPFEITDWEPDRYWAWRVAGVPATGHRVEPLGPKRCRVSFLIPHWAPFYRPVCRRALRRIAALPER